MSMSLYPDASATYVRLSKISRMVRFKKKHNITVGIIVPPSPFVVPNGWEFVHTAPFEGPSVIAALLRGMGFGVIILDQRDDFNPYALAGGPLRNLDIVAVTTYEDSFPFIRTAAKIAKEEDNKRPVILGGPLVTSVPRLIMENTVADYAVIGEGELTTIELMDLLMNKRKALPAKKIQGLAWKDSGGFTVLNPRRPQMYNLDAVPVQDLSLWPRIQKSGRAQEIYMTSSRGCPGRCNFCFRTMPALRYKSASRVRRELLSLKKRYRYKFIWWSDLTFVDSKARVHKLMNEAFKGINFRWSCFTRVDGIDLPTLKLMKEQGCDIVMYGFESITKEILDYFKKKVSKNQIIKAITLTRKAGLKVGGLFIIGGPGETKKSLNRVMDFCKQFKEVTRVKYMAALPGTPLYYDALRKGTIKSELKHLYFLAKERSVEDDKIINFTNLSKRTLRAAYREINRRIEARPYEYGNSANHCLDKPKKFMERPVIMSNSGTQHD